MGETHNVEIPTAPAGRLVTTPSTRLCGRRVRDLALAGRPHRNNQGPVEGDLKLPQEDPAVFELIAVGERRLPPGLAHKQTTHGPILYQGWTDHGPRASVFPVEAGFKPVGPRRTFEGAVEQIAEQIRLGELAAGERLPSERDLAAAMQISRATLREAARVLVGAGVLEVRPGSAGGMYVLSDYAPLDLLRSMSDLRLDEVAGVLEARRLIEPRVAQLAAVRATDEDYAELQRTIDAQRALSRAATCSKPRTASSRSTRAFTCGSRGRAATRHRLADADAFPPPRDRARPGDARAADRLLGDRRARADARRDPLRRPRAHRGGHGRAPRGDGALLGARHRPPAGAPAARLPAPARAQPDHIRKTP